MKRILKHKISGLPAQVAWAENERGFDVLQMQLSSVVLPSIPGATVPARGVEGERQRALLVVYCSSV